QDIFQLPDIVLRQFHTIDDTAEEIHTAEIDLKSLYSQALKCLDGNQQNLNIGAFPFTAIMFDTDLRELTLPAAFRLFKPQDLTAIEQTNRLWRRSQPRRDGLGN